MAGWIAMALLVFGAAGWFVTEKRKRTTHPVPPGLQADLTFPHEETFELYHNALSLCSMKSRLAMAELRIPYKSHHIDLIETGAYENLRPRLLRVNPAGTVPVLLHEGHPIYESHEQIRYAAKFAPPSVDSLVPEDPERRAQMEAWIDRSSLTEDPIHRGDETAGNAMPGQTLPLFCAMIEKIPYTRIFEGFLFHFDKFRPLLFTILKVRGIEKLHRIKPVADTIEKSRAQLRVHLEALEAHLEKGGGPWICGDRYSLADVSWTVIFQRMRQADCEAVFLDPGDRPRVARYWQSLRARPAYTEAILEHTHPLIEHGRTRIASAKAADADLRACLEGRAQGRGDTPEA